MSGRIRLTHAFDAYCGWCFGFGPALHEFAEVNAERIDLRVLSGGLFTGGAPIAAYPHILEANQRISQLSGVTFGDGYLRLLADGSAVMDSIDAATGLVALGQGLDAAAAMQRAWYADGRSLSDPQGVPRPRRRARPGPGRGRCHIHRPGYPGHGPRQLPRGSPARRAGLSHPAVAQRTRHPPSGRAHLDREQAHASARAAPGQPVGRPRLRESGRHDRH